MKITRTINGKSQEIELTKEEMRQASQEWSFDCRTEDIISKIREKIAEPFKSLSWFSRNSDIVDKMTLNDENRAQEAAEDMVSSVERTLNRNDIYWDIFWDAIEAVVGEELCGLEYTEEQITVKSQDHHIYVTVENRVAADITPEAIKIFDFGLFAESENREIIAKKLSFIDKSYAT